jgi:hypothetical protein
MNKNPLDPFEQFVQNTANEHIEPLNMAPWNAIEKKTSKRKRRCFSNHPGYGVLLPF